MAGFQQHYTDNIEKKFDQLLAGSARKRLWAYLTVPPLLAGMLYLTYWLFVAQGRDNLFSAFLVLVYIVVATVVSVGPILAPKDEMKRFLLKQVCRHLDLTFTPVPKTSPVRAFARLLPEKYKHAGVEGQILGNVGTLSFKSVECWLSKHEKPQFKLFKGIVFRGLLIEVELPEDSQAPTRFADEEINALQCAGEVLKVKSLKFESKNNLLRFAVECPDLFESSIWFVSMKGNQLESAVEECCALLKLMETLDEIMRDRSVHESETKKVRSKSCDP